MKNGKSKRKENRKLEKLTGCERLFQCSFDFNNSKALNLLPAYARDNQLSIKQDKLHQEIPLEH